MQVIEIFFTAILLGPAVDGVTEGVADGVGLATASCVNLILIVGSEKVKLFALKFIQPF